MSKEGPHGVLGQDPVMPAGCQPFKNHSNWARNLQEFLPLILLVGVTLAAFANAWPNTLVLDDKFFAGTGRFGGLLDLPRFFTEDLWAAAEGHSGLYRPLLLISLSLDAHLYGDWAAGYHLGNIFLHVLVTLCVFGFIRQLLLTAGGQPSSAGRYALLAALVFAVHPVHTEVVNSIFNRSEALATLGGVAGLWWFLHHLDSRPVKAWLGLAVAYLFAMFAKENAVVLPGLAIVLVWVFTPGGWPGRLRKCLPVLWLLIPLAFYLVLRVRALAPAGAVEAAGLIGVAEIRSLIQTSRLPDGGSLLKTAGAWGQAFKVMLWPHPLKLDYEAPSVFFRWSALVLHLLLIIAALFESRRKRFGLIAGLAVFYIALLPASRFVGTLGYLPELAERYLYFPSVGLAIALAFGLRFLGHRFGLPVALVPAVLAVLVLTPLCWARNAEWGSEALLFESEFSRRGPDRNMLRTLTAAHLDEGNYARVAEICDLHAAQQQRDGRYSNHCAIAYGRLGRNEKAERAYLFATRHKWVMSSAHANLAQLYLRLGRRDEARKHLELAIETERDPALRAYRKGMLLVMLHRSDRAKLEEARAYFEEALRLDPHMAPARLWLERLNRVLGPP